VETGENLVGNALPGVPNRDSSTGQAGIGTSVKLVQEASSATVSPATPSSIPAGAIVPRRRFQKGNIIIRGKTPRRYGMFREDILQSNGTFKRVRRCVLLGPVSGMSDRAAWKSFQPYLDRVNVAAKMPPKSGVTLESFVKEWRTNVAVNLKGRAQHVRQSHICGRTFCLSLAVSRCQR
jgi:hypothetical protein